MKQILVIREDSDYFAHKVQLFELEVGPAEKGRLGKTCKVSSEEAINTRAFH